MEARWRFRVDGGDGEERESGSGRVVIVERCGGSAVGEW